MKRRSPWSIFHGPVILPYILKPFWYVNTILQDYESVWHNIWPQNKCRPLWPIFHGPVMLPHILKTIWCMNIILQDYESYDLAFDLKINVGHCDLYFMVQWFCLISWRPFDIWTPYFGIMSQYDLKINVGHCDLYFMVQWCCLMSWRLIWYMNTILWDCESGWPDVRPTKIIVGHCDLYFMVQWFCLISWRLFDIWTPYFGIMSQFDLMFDLKIFHGPVILPYILKTVCCMNIILQDYESVWPDIWPQNKCRSLYSMVQWFCLISSKLFCSWTSYFGTMSQYDPVWHLNIYRSLWPIFHGPVILRYILNTVWCSNIILRDNESVYCGFCPKAM